MTRQPSLPSSAPRRRDNRWRVIALTVIAVAALGYGFKLMPGNGVVADFAGAGPTPSSLDNLAGSIAERQDIDVPVPVEEQILPGAPNAEEARRQLKEASDLIRAKRYDDAIRHLNEARERIKDVPQSYLVLGRALEGKGDYATARDFYNAAIDRDPALSDAYWGFATT
jgi:tetratricopeptide (TPR) repeat protein